MTGKGIDAEEAGAFAYESGFFFEFAQGGLFCGFSAFDESSGEGPESFLGFDGALHHEEFAIFVCEETAGGGDGVVVVEFIAVGAVGAHGLPVIAFDEFFTANRAVVPDEGYPFECHGRTLSG